MNYEAAYKILFEYVEVLSKHDLVFTGEYEVPSKWKHRTVMEVAADVLDEAQAALTKRERWI